MIVWSSLYTLEERHSKESRWLAHHRVLLGCSTCSESSSVDVCYLHKSAGSEHQWQKCRVYAAISDKGPLVFLLHHPARAWN